MGCTVKWTLIEADGGPAFGVLYVCRVSESPTPPTPRSISGRSFEGRWPGISRDFHPIPGSVEPGATASLTILVLITNVFNILPHVIWTSAGEITYNWPNFTASVKGHIKSRTRKALCGKWQNHA